MSEKNENVFEFPGGAKPEPTTEEQERRRMEEVKRLANLPDSFRLHQMRHAGRAELVGLTPKELEDLVAAEVKAREKQEKRQKQEDRQREKRAAQMKDREERKTERQHKAAQAAIDKEAKAKEAAKAKRLTEIAKLPAGQRDTAIEELAAKLGYDPYELRDEFAQLAVESAGWQRSAARMARRAVGRTSADREALARAHRENHRALGGAVARSPDNRTMDHVRMGPRHCPAFTTSRFQFRRAGQGQDTRPRIDIVLGAPASPQHRDYRAEPVSLRR
jgi:hypothetical protein